MHVAQVSGGKVASTPTAAGDVDLLALVLGGGAVTAEDAPFPATLEAAIAEGAPDEADDASTSVDEEPAPGDGDPALALAAALAASLAVEEPIATVAADPAATDASSGEIGVDGPTIDATVIEAAIAAPAQTAGTMAHAARGAALNAPAIATTTAHVAAAGVAAVAAPAGTAKPPTAVAAAAAPAEPEDAPDEHATAPVETSAETATKGAGPATAAVATVRPAASPHASAETPSRHHASVTASDRSAAGAADADGDRAERHAALDLGSSDVHAADGAPAPKGAPARLETTTGAAQHGLEAARLAASPAAPDAAPSLPPPTLDGAKPDAVTRTAPTPAPAAASHASELIPRWSERVTDAIRLSSARDGGEIRLQLEPEGLGHIDVRLHLHSDGVRAVIVAEHESTRALLTSQQQVLEQAFARSDLRLAGFSVDVGSGHGSALPDAPSPHDGDAGGSARGATASAGGEGGELVAAPLAEGRVSVRV